MAPPCPTTPFVSAAIVNYNGLAYLSACLDSLEAQEGVRLDILLVDNASSDGSIAMVRERYPGVRVIENDRNLGYAAALNQAADAMAGDHMLALNTDISLTPRFTATLAACIERHAPERCGYAQGKVRFMTEAGEPTRRLYSTGHLFTLSRVVYNRAAGHVDRGQYDNEQCVPGANAACLLLAREMLEDLRTPETGVFDPLFFMYGGDVDFDWLAALRGWAAWYCPEALAYHIGEGSSHISSRGFDAPFFNSRFLMMLKNDRACDVVRDLARIVARNVRDYIAMVRVNPPLLWRIPLHLVRHAIPALRSRRATRHLRHKPALAARDWMRWGTRLLKQSDEKR
jgi:GT2 family glycosyltransferase